MKLTDKECQSIYELAMGGQVELANIYIKYDLNKYVSYISKIIADDIMNKLLYRNDNDGLILYQFEVHNTLGEKGIIWLKGEYTAYFGPQLKLMNTVRRRGYLNNTSAHYNYKEKLGSIKCMLTANHKDKLTYRLRKILKALLTLSIYGKLH